MAITIGRYQFDGPFQSTASLDDRAGVYAILDERTPGSLSVIDVGESATVKARVETHDREQCWRRNTKGAVRVAVLYTPHVQQSGRRAVEQELRGQYSPPCGEQ